MANFISGILRRLGKGSIPKKVAEFLGGDVVPTAKRLVHPERAANAAKGTVEEFAEFLGGEIVIANTPEKKAWYQQLVGIHESWRGGAGYAKDAGFITVNPELVRETFRGEATKAGLSPEIITRAVGSDDFLKAVLYHESLERGMAQRFSSLSPMPASHYGSQVLLGEAGFIKAMGNKDVEALFRAVRGQRKEEKAAFKFGYNLFSARDDAYNTIEGLRHGGMAEWMRKILTDFGSGYDRLRAIAKMMGKTFEEVIESSAWKEALGRAKIVKKLGEGSFGTAELLETQFGGETIRLVRKTLKPNEEMERLLARHRREGYKYLLSASSLNNREDVLRRGLDLTREARAYRELGETPLVPSLYGGGKSARDPIYMELMPGYELHEIMLTPGMAKGFRLPENARTQLKETIREAAERGIVNPDIHGGNVLYDPISRRVSWIDWGLVGFNTSRHMAQETMERKAFAQAGMFHSERSLDMVFGLARMPSPSSVRKKILGSADTVEVAIVREESIKTIKVVREESIDTLKVESISRRSSKMNSKKMSDQLNSDKQQVWDNAYYGGRNHQRRKNSFNSTEKR